MKATIHNYQHLKGAELIEFLVANKSALVAQKKSMLKHTEALSVAPAMFHATKEGGAIKAATVADIPADAESIHVKVVANTANWCDSHMDVLLPDCWKKSIKERKGFIPHLRDHKHDTHFEVGIVKDIYSTDLSLVEFGINRAGTTQALIFETEIMKSFDARTFERYKSGRATQHSIGLMYMKIQLAVNDKKYAEEKDIWDKYSKQIINLDYVEEKGYFWAVPEIKLLENSVVLIGSNELTPTLEVGTVGKSDNTTTEQPQATKNRFASAMRSK